MPDDVPEAEKHERNQLLLEELNTSVARHNQTMLGSVVQVLVEGPSPRNGQRWCGRSDLNKMVLFPPSPQLHPGDIRDFVISRTTGNALYGELKP